jgi:hypothetical protein
MTHCPTSQIRLEKEILAEVGINVWKKPLKQRNE